MKRLKLAVYPKVFRFSYLDYFLKYFINMEDFQDSFVTSVLSDEELDFLYGMIVDARLQSYGFWIGLSRATATS